MYSHHHHPVHELCYLCNTPSQQFPRAWDLQTWQKMQLSCMQAGCFKSIAIFLSIFLFFSFFDNIYTYIQPDEPSSIIESHVLSSYLIKSRKDDSAFKPMTSYPSLLSYHYIKSMNRRTTWWSHVLSPISMKSRKDDLSSKDVQVTCPITFLNEE